MNTRGEQLILVNKLSENTDRLNEKTEELEEIKQINRGLRNMFSQYINEINTILDKVNPVLPVYKYSSQLDIQKLDIAKQWVIENEKGSNENKLLKENEVIIVLGPVRMVDQDNCVIDLLVYEKQKTTDREGEVLPRPIGKDYWKHMYIEMENNNGIWEVSGYKNFF